MPKHPELHPMSDEDVEAIYDCLGLSPEDLEDMKNESPTRFDEYANTNNPNNLRNG
jgi:hypothetical protein